jgi:hypothetical protein
MENKNIFLFCKIAVFSVVLTLLAGWGGCGSNKSKNVVGGIAVGALLGGGIGAALGSSTTTAAATTATTTATSSALTGAAIGAGTGAAVGAAIGASCSDEDTTVCKSQKKCCKTKNCKNFEMSK